MGKGTRGVLRQRSVRSLRKLGGLLSRFQQITTHPPPLSIFSHHGFPVFHKLKISEFCHLLPRHKHNNIAVSPSYDYYASSSWFSGLPFKFSSGNLCVSGYKFPHNLHDYQCVRCSQLHHHYALLCVALCPTLEHLAQAIVAATPPPLTLITQQWWHVANKDERRHFIRTLVPETLCRAVSLPQQGMIKPAHMLLLKQALINRRPEINGPSTERSNGWETILFLGTPSGSPSCSPPATPGG